MVKDVLMFLEFVKNVVRSNRGTASVDKSWVTRKLDGESRLAVKQYLMLLHDALHPCHVVR